MAVLSPKAYPGNWYPEEFDGATYSKFMQEAETAFEKLWKSQPKSTAKSLVGAVLRFPRGDGYAIYVVVKDKPLTVAHVPIGDAWATSASEIRGLRAQDVRQQLKQNEIWGS